MRGPGEANGPGGEGARGYGRFPADGGGAVAAVAGDELVVDVAHVVRFAFEELDVFAVVVEQQAGDAAFAVAPARFGEDGFELGLHGGGVVGGRRGGVAVVDEFEQHGGLC